MPVRAVGLEFRDPPREAVVAARGHRVARVAAIVLLRLHQRPQAWHECAMSWYSVLCPPLFRERVCLGEGKNGIVRYVREEVIAYEQSRRVRVVA